MALPSFLQAMFTPQRSGSYQWQNRADQGGGEFTGEIEGVYEGDAQDLIFKPRAHRGPGNTVGQEMPSAVRSNPTGSGETLETKISDLIPTGYLEPGGITSITEVMQSTPVGDEFGGAPAMGYVTPSDPMGSGADRMLGYTRYGEGTQPSYSMRDRHAEEGPGMFSRAPTTVGDPMFVPAESSVRTVPSDMLTAGLTESQGGGYLPPPPTTGYTGTRGRGPISDVSPGSITNWLGERFSAPAAGETTNAWNAPGYQGDIEEGVTIPQVVANTLSTNPLARTNALRASQGQGLQWREWLSNLFPRSTTGAPGRGPRVRRGKY